MKQKYENRGKNKIPIADHFENAVECRQLEDSDSVIFDYTYARLHHTQIRLNASFDDIFFIFLKINIKFLRQRA